MSKTINLNIPRGAAERVAQEDIFVCSGCGKPAPSKIKSCDCATMVGFRMRGGKIEHSLLVDPHALIPPPQADREAVREAVKAMRGIAALRDENAILRTALVLARAIITDDRDIVVECNTIRPPNHPRFGQLTAEGKEQIAPYDNALSVIDAALRPTTAIAKLEASE